jgi:hypothetical protein
MYIVIIIIYQTQFRTTYELFIFILIEIICHIAPTKI